MLHNLKLLFAFLLAAGCTYAQKLPKVQTASIWAPANIKIDGKTTEWNGQFQAHNSGNHMYYTLSNDDKNLYLTACMEDIQGSNKIFKGGITFTILSPTKNTEKVSITFPVIKKRKPGEMGTTNNPLSAYSILKADTVKNRAKIDSLRLASNNGIMRMYNEIEVAGIPGLSDPLVSIYNTQGITVAASYDKKMRYTYELAIPLKYVEATIKSDVKSIKYNIRLNATPSGAGQPSAPSSPAPTATLAGPFRPASIDELFELEDSEFSGIYVLARKP